MHSEYFFLISVISSLESAPQVEWCKTDNELQNTTCYKKTMKFLLLIRPNKLAQADFAYVRDLIRPRLFATILHLYSQAAYNDAPELCILPLSEFTLAEYRELAIELDKCDAHRRARAEQEKAYCWQDGQPTGAGSTATSSHITLGPLPHFKLTGPHTDLPHLRAREDRERLLRAQTALMACALGHDTLEDVNVRFEFVDRIVSLCLISSTYSIDLHHRRSGVKQTRDSNMMVAIRKHCRSCFFSSRSCWPGHTTSSSWSSFDLGFCRPSGASTSRPRIPAWTRTRMRSNVAYCHSRT